MTERLELTIGRDFTNRSRGEDDNSELAWTAHRERAEYLLGALESDPTWQVEDWGDTFDEDRTHEDVTVVLLLAAKAVGMAALVFGGKVLLRSIEDTAVDAIKRLIKKLIPGLESGTISRNYIRLSDGAVLEWRVPGYENEVDFSVSNSTNLTLADFLASLGSEPSASANEGI